MSVEWPEALPLPQFGLRYSVADPQMRTLMASGRTIARRRFSDVPTEFSARWILRQSEAEIFEQFYQNDAVDGSEWIEMPMVTAQGEGVHYVRFRGAYRYRRVGPGLWEYSANMRMYLRPASGIEPPISGGDGPDPEPPIVSCGVPVDYAGGQSFPSSATVILGEAQGLVTLRCQTYSIPDKFEVWIGGIKVLDTGYLGARGYQSALNDALDARGLPPETIIQEGSGDTYFSFVKDSSETEATVLVYAPLEGTAWNFRLGCPFETNWSPLPRGLETTSTAGASRLAYGSGNVWVVVFDDARASRSTDNGVTWTALPQGLNAGSTSFGIADIATDGDGVWVALFLGGHAARSVDNGATWEALPRYLGSFSYFNRLVTDGNGTWIAFRVDWPFWVRSTDNGQSWSELPALMDEFSYEVPIRDVCVGVDGVWVAVCSSGYAARSADGGASWTELARGLNSGSTIINFEAINTDGDGTWIAAGGSGYAARSIDDGLTWAALPRGLNCGNLSGSIRMIETDGDGTWVVLNSNRYAARSVDNGETWEALPRGMTATNTSQAFLSIKTDRDGNWLVTRNGGFAHYSIDNGASWVDGPNSLNGGASGLSIHRSATDGNGIWIAVMSSGYVSRGTLG